MNIIGTSADSIDAAEDRERFQKVLNDLGLRQPPNHRPQRRRSARQSRRNQAIRSSCVRLTSSVAAPCRSSTPPKSCKIHARSRQVSEDSPVLLDFFLNNAIEVDVDCVSTAKISRYRRHHAARRTGGHPLRRLRLLAPLLAREKTKTKSAAKPKPWHTHWAWSADERTVCRTGRRGVRAGSKPARQPYRSPSSPSHRRAARQSRRTLHGRHFPARARRGKEVVPDFYAVKAVFPFIKFPGVDTILGPEMRSTGEVMGVGCSFGEAYYKAQLGAGERLNRPAKSSSPYATKTNRSSSKPRKTSKPSATASAPHAAPPIPESTASSCKR